MAAIIDLNERRRRRNRAQAAPKRAKGPRMVTCAHCGAQHPIVRLPGNERRCVSGFFDGQHWFCRNRGCRRAWLDAL